jgi:hypothetical protein
MPALEVNIHQRAGGEQAIGIFVETTVAHHGEAEYALHNMEGMFDLCPHF